MTIERDPTKLRDLAQQIATIEQEPKVLGNEVDAQRLAITTSDALLHVLAALEELARRVERMEAERRFR
jgi:hypothetical protein